MAAPYRLRLKRFTKYKIYKKNLNPQKTFKTEQPKT